MEPIIYVTMALSCGLAFCIGLAVTIFLVNRKSLRRLRNSSRHSSAAGSSTRSRFAARWAHMEHASVGRGDKTFQDALQRDPGAADEDVADEEVFLSEFGRSHSSNHVGQTALNHHASRDSFVGTGPNGTRTFLRGWFGLDEPTFSGFTLGPANEKGEHEDALAMSPPTGNHGPHTVPTLHHPIPTAEGDDWETSSAHEQHP